MECDVDAPGGLNIIIYLYFTIINILTFQKVRLVKKTDFKYYWIHGHRQKENWGVYNLFDKY